MFHCPKCDGPTGVLVTRAELRKRACTQCGHRFMTEETEYEPPPWRETKHGKNPFYTTRNKRTAKP